ncbi:MAG: Nif3-like dinuclear metal center hexameric protein [Proteobacteria bacterium]|nr:Nif3-like dinuclear metal center hexameric protein [Pseudomonadota bacterium]
MYTVTDVNEALNVITNGRVIMKTETAFGTGSPFVVTKSSNIPGKAITETPGLVVGNPKLIVKKIAVGMTLTESAIELAGATGVDAIVLHHPVADAASSGGVPLRNYSVLYGLAIFEVHEAFHGRHPGIAWMHGHVPFKSDIHYGGIPGNVVFVGKPLPDVKKLGDIVDRLTVLADLSREKTILKSEQEQRQSPAIQEANIAAAPEILLGTRESKVGTILHIFPHTGFTPQHMRQLKKDYPDIDTVVVSISRVKKDNPLVATAKELGLTMVLGNSHALEIVENGVPLAYALKSLLPGVEVVLFRERMTSAPVDVFGSKAMRDYGQEMAGKYLVPKK